MRLLPCGPQAMLAEYDSLAEVMAVAEQLRQAQLDEVLDIVPAARTVLVQHVGGPTAAIEAVLRTTLAGRPPAGRPPAGPTPADRTSQTVVVPVRYDGPDLADVAAATGTTVDEVIARHAAATYTAAFCGFMPGFAYLTGLDERLHLPRRPTPRTRVPAGSVAIGSEFTGVYPTVSPGGWHLLGTSDVVLWDESRWVPALIVPGATVRFQPR